jgi:hypothetical protein
MRVWQRILFCAAAALVVLGPATVAFGASVSGRASTVVEWFDTPEGHTAVPVYQYLLLHGRDLDGKGLDFSLYGRLADDLTSEADVDSRLYHAFLDKRNLLPDLDARLGRQFIATTAGASVMDGLLLRYRGFGPVTLSLFGGGDVKYYDGYNAKDLIFGAEVKTRFLDELLVGLSYVQKWERSNLTHELIGLDVDYVFMNLLNVYSETQYNWLSDDVSYFLLGARYYRSPLWGLRAEYLYSLPVFASTSIYSVFAVSEYEHIMGEVDFRLQPGLRAFVRYTREMYEDFRDADVFEAGLEKIRTDRFSGYLVGTWREDRDGQDLRGFKVRAAWLFNRHVEAGIGAHVDVLERRWEPGEKDETTASRLWADTTVFLKKNIDVQGKVERIESDIWDYYYQGRLRLNIYF